MKIAKIALISLAVSVGTAFYACGSSEDNSTTVEETTVVAEEDETEPVDFDHGEQKMNKSQMDSITNHPDEMSAGEATGALLYLYRSVEKSSGSTRMIAMRKFIDFYNIVLSNHGNDLRSSIKKVNKKENIDLSKIYETYAAMLSSGDEGGASVNDVKVDTIRTVSNNGTTVSTVVSEEATITTTVGE